MKYNMDQHLVGYNGTPITKTEDDKSPVSLGDALSMACVNANPQTHNTGDKKMKIYRILQKCNAEGDVELEAEEVSLLKELVGESYGVAMVGTVYDILESPTEPESEEETPAEE